MAQKVFLGLCNYAIPYPMGHQCSSALIPPAARMQGPLLFRQIMPLDDARSSWEVVVAQLAERSPTISEDPGSNPVIGNFYLNIYLLLTVCRKDENKEKEAENGPF